MNLEILQEKLAHALIHINKSVSSKPNIPILNNVLIETEKSFLKLSSTNLEIGITTRIPANVSDEGSVTVSARLLSEFVNSLKSGKLELFMLDQKVVVKSVDNSAEFFTMSPEDFPSVPHSEGEPVLKIKAIEFADAITQTALAAATDNSRPVLTGLLVKATKRHLTLVGVDGFRLSHKVIELENGPDEDLKEIIPAKSLLEFAKIVKDTAKEKDFVEFFTLKTKNQIILKLNDIELATRLIEGEFPAYEEILPKDKQYSASLLKSELLDAVKIVNIFARNAVGNKARFVIDSMAKKLNLSAVVVDVGNNTSSVEIPNYMGEDFETAFNARFLLEMINVVHGDEIIFESNGTTAPGVFKDKNDENFLHVIMPMRLE